jgi:uracil-DNA glycosylase family 4
MMEKHSGCDRCPYVTHSFVPSEGPEDADIMLVGESPARHEVRLQKPFQGESGELLNTAFEANDMHRKKYYITNAVKCCRAEDEDETNPEAITMCYDNFLKREIAAVNPKLLVPMGNVALQSISKKKGILKARSLIYFQDFTYKKKKFKLKIIPTLHMAFILRQRALEDFMLADFKLIKWQGTSRKMLLPPPADYAPLQTWRGIRTYLTSLLTERKPFATDTETTGLNPDIEYMMDASFTTRPYFARSMHFYLNHDADAQAEVDRAATGRAGKKPRKEFLKPNPILTPRRLRWVAKMLYKLLHSGIEIRFQNEKFDLRVYRRFILNHLGPRYELDPQRINSVDVLPAAHLWNENLPKNLKDLARMWTDILYTKEEIDAVKGGTLIRQPWEKRGIYNCKDADATFRIYPLLRSRLKTRELLWELYQTREMPDIKNLLQSEVFGMLVSKDKINEVGRRIKGRMDHFRDRMRSIAGKKFNPRSNPQLTKVMFKRLRMPFDPEFINKKSNLPSTNKEHIKWITQRVQGNHARFLRALSLQRQYGTLYGTFVKGIRKTMDLEGRVHCDFLLWGTTSGRLACKNPNLLNIPRDGEFEGTLLSIRDIFVARPGYQIVDADFSQIEYKLLAIFSNEEKILAQVRRGDDFHTITARALESKKMRKAEALAATSKRWARIMKDIRNRAKRFNFALVYGAGEDTLAQAVAPELYVANREKALALVRRYTERHQNAYPKLWEYLKKVPKLAVQDGELQLPNGRIRRFPKTHDKTQLMFQERQAGNFQAQGMGAYVMRAAYSRICQRFRDEGIAWKKMKVVDRKGNVIHVKVIDSFPMNIIYDSILAEVKNKHVNRAQQIIAEEMLKPVPELDNFVFAIEMGVGQSWHLAEVNAYKVKMPDEVKPWTVENAA